jgi:hypothetical protein
MLAFIVMRELHRHVDAEELERYSMGTSSHEETRLVEEHLLTCEGCRHLLQETDDYLLSMRMASRQIRREERSEQPRKWRFPAWIPALAAVACGLLLLAVITLRSGRPPGPVVAVSLTALRNNGAGSSAPAGQELMLHPDLTGLAESSSYRLEIVDQTGHPMRQGKLESAQNGIKVPGLGAGTYFVRVYLPSGELLREYGLEVR